MRDIVVCGVPRSGSTLIWQIFREIFPDQEIKKVHSNEWISDGSMAIISIRNPYDLVASLYRVRISRGGENVGDADGLEIVLDDMKTQYKNVPKMMNGLYMLFRYEDFYDNFNVIYNRIKEVLNISVPSKVIKRIEIVCSLKTNRKRAAKLKNFNQVDADGIHGDHIGAVIPGYWARALPKWAHKRTMEGGQPIAADA